MHTCKRLIISIAVLGLLFGVAAEADPNPNLSSPIPQTRGTKVGVGVICDTSDEAEQYVRLRAAGQDIIPAVSNVNAAMQQPRACGLAAIAFVRDQAVDTKSVRGKLVKIVRIKVIAGFNGRAWHPIPAAVQYAIIETEGLAI